MKNFGNSPRYRFNNAPAPIPANETREERIKRLLKLMPPSVNRDPKLIPNFLKRAIASEDAARAASKNQ